MRRDGIAASGLFPLRLLPRPHRSANRERLALDRPMAKIAVDAMGGDRAPGVVVEGALLAARESGTEVILVGQADAVQQELARRGKNAALPVIAATEVVAMHESPSSALRKKDSSMKVAFELMKRGDVDAVVSAGNSGAMMATGMLVMGTLPQVARPAILIVVPSVAAGTVIVDAGANVDCKPQHLVQFGLMGSIYAERVLGVSKPRVGVLSNGEEEGKGTLLTRAASELLSATTLHYIGYVEGRDFFNGKVDVVVCDGFTGNVALKTIEGVASFAASVLKGALRKNLTTRIGSLMIRKSLKEAYNRLDYAEYGGAPLIGLDGVAIVAHGGSDPRAIKNAIRAAGDAVEHEVNRQIMEALGATDGLTEEKTNGLPGRLWRKLKSKIDSLGDKPETVKEGEE